jgi:hypothetical protein
VNPNGSVLNAPAPAPIEDIFPAIAISPTGNVYIGAYRGTVVSPWQTCAQQSFPGSEQTPLGAFCNVLGNYTANTRIEYVVRNLATVTQTVSTFPINIKYQPNSTTNSFIGDYTHMAVGSDGIGHAVFMDSNSLKNYHWVDGVEVDPSVQAHNQEIAHVPFAF